METRSFLKFKTLGENDPASRMNVCLITAPTVTEFTMRDEINSESVKRAASEPQLGILSLAAVLEQRGDSLRIIDLNRAYLKYASGCASPAQEFVEAAAQLVVDCNSEIYAFGSICSSYPLTIRIAEAVKGRSRDSTVLFGGPQASVVDIQTLAAFSFIDLILRGEAERSLPILLHELEGTHKLDLVPGLTHRCASRPKRNCNSPAIEDLDSLPSPAYHMTTDLVGARTAALELGRGCPFACSFCSTNDFFRRNFRLRSPARVLRDMRAIAAEYSIRDFGLVHDMFTVDRRRVVAFCKAMISSGEKFTWSCSARTDCVDQELLELMSLGGCVGIFLGVESGSRRVQEIIDKHLDPEQAEKVIDTAEQLGIRTTVSLITGFPEETWDDVKQTMHMFMYSARHSRSNPQLNLLAPLAETPIYSAHRNQLVLAELCSDVSQQSANRDEADLNLIRAHPDIFPNFYLLLTPFLDHGCLLELREFSLIGTERFRWLLSAIDQGNAGVVDLFLDWREYRLHSRPSLTGFDLRRYYRLEFPSEFLSFLRTHPLGKTAIIGALLDYEDRVFNALSEGREERTSGTSVPPEAGLWWSDTAVLSSDAHLIELSFDIQQLVDALKGATLPKLRHGVHYYVTRQEIPGVSRLHRVSDWVASVLRSCKHPRSVSDILEQLATEITEVEEHLHRYTFVKLLKGAQANGFIRILRSENHISRRGESKVVVQ
jgi:radical SAM superfamily enzyme YgiQ (UPF0313 family)